MPDLEEPEQTAEKVDKMKDPLAVLPAAYAGYHMPALGSPEFYAMSVLGFILSHGESSRLYRKLIYHNNWVSGLSVGPNQYKGPQLFFIWFQVQSAVNVDEVLQAVGQELEAVREKKIPVAEIEKAKTQITFHFVAQMAKVARIGELLAHYALFFGDPHRINQELDRYLAVTQEDILQAAQQVFRPQNRTLILVEPGT
jgi:predicted Zn-dependent peptidase